MSTDLIIARVDQARGLLAEARDATDAKKVADIARAAEVYARRQKLSEQAIAYAHEICVEAKALLGEFLKSAPKNEGGYGPGRGKKGGTQQQPAFVQPPTLADIGLTKQESAEAQFMAEVKESEPETFAAIKQGKKSVTEAKRAAKEKRREARRAANKEKVAAVQSPTELVGAAQFATIVIDPPWDWGDEGDVDQLGRARPQYERGERIYRWKQSLDRRYIIPRNRFSVSVGEVDQRSWPALKSPRLSQRGPLFC